MADWAGTSRTRTTWRRYRWTARMQSSWTSVCPPSPPPSSQATPAPSTPLPGPPTLHAVSHLLLLSFLSYFSSFFFFSFYFSSSTLWREIDICTAGDDKQAYIWDLSMMPKPIEDPILAYGAEAEINQLQWSISQPDWISIAFSNKMQILRV